MQGITRNFANRDFAFALDVSGDIFFPRVSFVAGSLFGHDMSALEIFIGPPMHAFPETNDRFGK